LKEFDQIAKRCHSGPHHTISSGPTIPPAIHLHLPGLDTSTQSCAPLANETHVLNSSSPSKLLNVIDVFDSDDDVQLLTFPPIIQVLSNLDVIMPLLNYQQYETTLVQKGIVYVNSIAIVQHSFSMDIVGMPEGAVGLFVKHAVFLTC
jgi:hypothetical protein